MFQIASLLDPIRAYSFLFGHGLLGSSKFPLWNDNRDQSILI